jgi:hypothetical protein
VPRKKNNNGNHHQLTINCWHLRQLPENLSAATQLFKLNPDVKLRQAWLPNVQPEFMPASVWTGWTDEAIGVYAELQDRDIFNAANGENQKCWQLGDVFEIFLRPLPADLYWEFHVTPENNRLQLLYPSEAFFREGNNVADDWLQGIGLPPNSFKSETLLLRKQNLWCVYAVFPLTLFGAAAELHKGDEWLANFCRFDYTRGQALPVLSATAEPKRADFHDNSSWSKLRFV